MEEFMLPCLNKQIFGIDCPGCGAQRAFLLVFQGEFNAAFKMFPAVYSLIILIFFLILNLFVKFKNDWYLKIGLIIFNAAVIITAYIYKMNHFFN